MTTWQEAPTIVLPRGSPPALLVNRPADDRGAARPVAMAV